MSDDLEVIDITGLDDDAIAGMVYATVEALCTTLETRGIESSFVDACLFMLFCERMYQNDSREEFEEMIEEALADPWPDAPTIH